MQILEDEQQRALLGEQLQDAAQTPVELGLRNLGGRVRAARRGRDAEDVGGRGRHRAQLVEIPSSDLLEERPELGRDLRRFLALEDAGGALHDLGHRPVGDPLPVRKTAAPEHRADVRGSGTDLLEQAALADAGRPHHGRRPGQPFAHHLLPQPEQLRELLLPADERAAPRLSPRRCLARIDDFPDRDRLRLPLRHDGLSLAVLDCVLRPLVGQLADDDTVDRRTALDSRGGVHHVTGGFADLLAGVRADHDDRFARVDAGSDVEVQPVVGRVQLLDRLRDRDGGADRALLVILVRRRRAEECDDGVADELRDAAPVELELAPSLDVVGSEPRADVFGIERLRGRGGADDVREDGRDEPPLLDPGLDRRRGGRGCRGRCRRHRRAARQAELRDVRIFLAATDTEGHETSVGSVWAFDEFATALRC